MDAPQLTLSYFNWIHKFKPSKLLLIVSVSVDKQLCNYFVNSALYKHYYFLCFNLTSDCFFFQTMTAKNEEEKEACAKQSLYGGVCALISGAVCIGLVLAFIIVIGVLRGLWISNNSYDE